MVQNNNIQQNIKPKKYETNFDNENLYIILIQLIINDK